MTAHFPDAIDPKDFDSRYRLSPDSWREPFLDLWRREGPPSAQGLDFQPFADGANLIAGLGPQWIMKVFPPFLRHQWVSEWRVMQHLDGHLNLPIPRFYKAGEQRGWTFVIMSRLPGITLEKVWPRLGKDDRKAILTDIGRIMARVHAIPALALYDLPPQWSEFLPAQIRGCRDRHERLGMPSWFVEGIDAFVKQNLSALPASFTPVILTGEYTPFNLLVTDKPRITSISGMIDFADSMVGFSEYDLLGPLLFSCEGQADYAEALLQGYGFPHTALTPALRRRLFLLQILHRYSDFKAQMRIPGWERVQSFEELEDVIWPMASSGRLFDMGKSGNALVEEV